MSGDSAGRAHPSDARPVPWRQAHREAVEAGRSTYIDPGTGFQVFTELGLKRRGRCCGSGCRHCPYQHESMRAGAKSPVRRQS